MDQIKKTIKRLAALYRLQKKLRRKKNDLSGRIADKKKAVNVAAHAANDEKLKAMAKCSPVKVILLAVIGIVGVFLGALAVKNVKRKYNDKYNSLLADSGAYDALMQFDDDAENTNYDKASLEELEQALYKVENELDEVSAAIEHTKK